MVKRYIRLKWLYITDINTKVEFKPEFGANGWFYKVVSSSWRNVGQFSSMECVSACFGAVVGIALLFQQIIAHVHLSILKFVSSSGTGCCCNKYIKSCNYYSKDSNSYRLTGYKISYRLVVNYNLSIYNDEIIRIKSKGKNHRGSQNYFERCS